MAHGQAAADAEGGQITMKRIEIVTGLRFGRWTVLSPAISRPYNMRSRDGDRIQIKKRWVHCRCACGQDRDVPLSNLRNGTSRSCGCLRTEMMVQRRRKRPGEACLNECWRSYRTNAVARGVSFLLTKDQFIAITGRNCHYCGAPPSNEITRPRSYGSFCYSGIDRQDNGQGYTVENSVPCCRTCNIAKADMTVKGFYEWVARIQAHI